MKDPDNFVDHYLMHLYDPVKAREYYLRTRELKGREAASVDPKSKVTYDGGPVVIKPGTRMEEDQTPLVSPSGAKLVDYVGAGLGTAKYADGSVFTSSGWTGLPKAPVTSKPITAAKKRKIGAAEQKIIRAKTLAKKIKDPVEKRNRLQEISAAEKRLKAILNSSVNVTRPVLRQSPTRNV